MTDRHNDWRGTVSTGPDTTAGSLRVILAAIRPMGVPLANWLPVSAAPFVLAIRSQGPDERLLSGKWVPAPIRKPGPVPR